jgi:hypothetical protein
MIETNSGMYNKNKYEHINVSFIYSYIVVLKATLAPDTVPFNRLFLIIKEKSDIIMKWKVFA